MPPRNRWEQRLDPFPRRIGDLKFVHGPSVRDDKLVVRTGGLLRELLTLLVAGTPGGAVHARRAA
jgi:hypothetical protein